MKKTPLYDRHKQLNGKMVDFAGWQLPVNYGSIVREHEAVRGRIGIFDVSHMGEFFFSGSSTRTALNWLISNIVPKAESNRAVYSGLLNEAGCFIDDVIAGMLDENSAYMVVNAANIAKDYEWVSSRLAAKRSEMNWDVTVTDRSAEYGLLAIQGAKVDTVLKKIFPTLSMLKPFSIVQTTFEDEAVIVAFTGYTGEPGVEVMIPNNKVLRLFDVCLELGVEPCGLGARDSLRLEKGYSLYGNELNETINAWEAGLGWTVKLKKEDFIGKKRLQELKADPAQYHNRNLVGLLIEGTLPVRAGAEIISSQNAEIKLGTVTSGLWSPTLNKPIALGYIGYIGGADQLDKETVHIKTRGRLIKANVTARTFV
ncbi:aminomethyltransferase [Spirochaetota bacterium]|nr:aminomethyltransferase [Spirochaetota bacterium]